MTGKTGNRRKRTVVLAAWLLAVCILVSGCAARSGESAGGSARGDDARDRISVVTTIFPQYDFVRQIAGDKVDLKMLLKPGEETHSYEPTPQDIIAIQNCDIFIYVGGENDAWVEDILESMPDTGMRTLRLVDCVETVEEEHVQGMEEQPGHSHEEEEEGHEEEHSVHEMDEHVWTSPENASLIVEQIAALLAETDPDNGGAYEENASAYQEELDRLDQEFREIVDHAQ